MAKSKLKGIESAKVIVYGDHVDSSRDWNTASLYLQKLGYDRPETVLEVKFQRDNLAFQRYSEVKNIAERDLPTPRFDFGEVWGRFYGASIETKFSVDRLSEMSACVKACEKIRDTISEYNLHLTSECELTRWITALEKLNVRTEEIRKVSSGGKWVDTYMHDLSSDRRHPARKLFEKQHALPARFSAPDEDFKSADPVHDLNDPNEVA